MKNIDYDRLKKAVHAKTNQLDIILEPYIKDIENGKLAVLLDGDKEPTTKGSLYLDDYVETLRDTLEDVQIGNPCFLCNKNKDCYKLRPYNRCFDSQEKIFAVFELNDYQLKELVKMTRY